LQPHATSYQLPIAWLVAHQEGLWDWPLPNEFEGSEIFTPVSVGEVGVGVDTRQEHSQVLSVNGPRADTVPQVLLHRGGQAVPLDSRHSGAEQVAGDPAPQTIGLGGITGFLKLLHTVLKVA